MYLKVAAYKEQKDSALACMVHGETAKVLSALTAIISSIMEEGMVEGLSEDEKQEAREAFYEAVLESLRHHEKDTRKNIC